MILNHFKQSEFECKCGCGLNNMKYETMIKLDAAREFAKVPFVLTSACRCKEHNKAVGGVETSSHLKGFAVDIAVNNSADRYKVVNALLYVGFKRIGIGSNFVHVDNDNKNNAIWGY